MIQSLAKCPTTVQYLHRLLCFCVILDLCSAVSGCDADADDDNNDAVSGILTLVGGPACWHGAFQLLYMLGSNLDASCPKLCSILLHPPHNILLRMGAQVR